MKYVPSFIIKILFTTVALWFILGMFYGVSLGDILLISFILSTVAYLGDAFILPNVSNFWATIGDFGLAFVGIYLLGLIFIDRNIQLADDSLLSGIVIAACEIFFHRYMKRNVIEYEENQEISRSITIPQHKLQPEISKELDEEE
ncbi:YndM family protein [Ornithinibacillus bavariensis]|uniref:Membrane protein YndM n=1 Tax=Ornithinibacillus bavariensis TaxID=545502 RepID=A0A919X7K9_9BACI|nr:YndM family protein [Ornithinibacillus bavariensis]GIO25927.1 putative membrane protein YndM [Ornithinibacillus bavariensis]